MKNLSDHLSQKKQTIDNYISNYFKTNNLLDNKNWSKLHESMAYTSELGGKRFRPILSLLTAELFEKTDEFALAYGTAVEFIHSYSLIHDDLPSMDDDTERRGKPTNHIKFGESTALLAGDALLTEAFYIIASNYEDHISAAIKELSYCAGMHGMVGGQVIDLANQEAGTELEELLTIHEMKTGALIRSSMLGMAILCGADKELLNSVREFSENLGLAFQIADDILDFTEQEEKANICYILGEEKSYEYLSEVSSAAKDCIKHLGEKAIWLNQLVDYNLNRKK